MITHNPEGSVVSDAVDAPVPALNTPPESDAAAAAPPASPRRVHSPYLPSEGIKMTLLEEGLLNGAGVLQGGRPAIEAYGLTEGALELFLAVASTMPEGLTRSRVPKHLAKAFEEHLVLLEIQDLVEWQRDARGRQKNLVLNWKGQETIDAARPKPVTSWAARRRAQVHTG